MISMILEHGHMATKWLALLVWPLGFAGLLMPAGNASGRAIFDGFSRPPTFTAPAGCIGDGQAYDLMAHCTKLLEPGHEFTVLIDTSVGIGYVDSAEFVLDRVDVARQWWMENFPGKATFSFKPSKIVPSNAPSHKTTCMEYSVMAKTEKDSQRVEGLACAWSVEKQSKTGNWTVESFWLEANDTYGPSQQPMASFDAIVHDVLLSARLTQSRQ
jgi:hypothetical protein